MCVLKTRGCREEMLAESENVDLESKFIEREHESSTIFINFPRGAQNFHSYARRRNEEQQAYD
jgi:hypothetical protein